VKPGNVVNPQIPRMEFKNLNKDFPRIGEPKMGFFWNQKAENFQKGKLVQMG